ncbi:MAG: hypothetical protein R6X02_20190 [Enhygromyxa sp.]
MASRDDRLAPATRNYVIFGLVFVAAVTLAICDWTDPRERRGETDSPLRLLLVSTHADGPASALADQDGFAVAQISPSEAIAEGRELLDDEQAPSYRAAITYADQLGFGFVALDLRDEDQQPLEWGLSAGAPGVEAPPPSSARFAVFSVGDVAPERPRMRSVGMPEGLIYDPRLVALDGLRLSLYDHPDLTRLWTAELNATEVQARRVLESRKIDERRTLLSSDHAAWRELAEVWPGPDRIPGSVAGPWERVQAAPIPGGLLLELRSVQVHVDFSRRPRLELAEEATLAFVPAGELQGPRRACEGLPERVSGPVAVAPDGSAVVIGGPLGSSELFVFEQRAPSPPAEQAEQAEQAEEPGCRARSIGQLELGDRAVGRPNAAGAMAWNYDDDWLHWWDRSGEHQLRVSGIDGYSGPWWVDDELLAMIGERPLTQAGELADDLPELGFEPAIVLLGTSLEAGPEDPELERPRIELGVRELFPAPEPEPEPALLDLRPAGPTELLFTTERCPGRAEDPRPCLHRLRAADTLASTIRELTAGATTLADAFTVETLGPLDPHLELAVAADGSRVAWIDRATHNLMAADLRGPSPMVPRRIDPDPAPEASLRISADARVLLSEIEVELTLGRHTLGTLRIARAFLSDPAD